MKEALKRVPDTVTTPKAVPVRSSSRILVDHIESLKILEMPSPEAMEASMQINILLERAQDKIEEACMLATKACFLLADLEKTENQDPEPNASSEQSKTFTFTCSGESGQDCLVNLFNQILTGE